MDTILSILERELENNRLAYEASEVVKSEMIATFRNIANQAEGDKYADKYNTHSIKSREYRDAIYNIEQAMYYIKRVIKA